LRWIYKAREIASEYRNYIKEYQLMQEILSAPNNIHLPVQNGQISRPTESAAIAFSAARIDYIESAINAVEYAMHKVAQKPEGEITKKLIKMVYENKTHTLEGASLELNICYRTARRYNNYYLKLIAGEMGFINLKRA